MNEGDDCSKLLQEIKLRLGYPGERELREEPPYYRDSLALCIIDSVQSLRHDYARDVVPVLNRYIAYRSEHGGNAHTDGAQEFLDALREMGGISTWTTSIGTAHKAPGTSVLTGEVMRQGAAALIKAGIESTEQMRQAACEPDELARVRKAWVGVHGLGKASWDYVLMGAGVDGSKADTMIRRFATRAFQEDKMVSPVRAQEALKKAAKKLRVTERRLDHAIWFYESDAAARARKKRGRQSNE